MGTWQKQKAIKCKYEAEEIGRLLAEKNHTIISGAGTGNSKLIIDAYRKHGGQKYIAYLPDRKEMERVGEEIGPKPDEIIETNNSYPERNIEMIKNCDAIVALNGGLGTLAEIIHAVKDFDKKVVVFDKEKLADWIKLIDELKERVVLTDNINEAIDQLT